MNKEHSSPRQSQGTASERHSGGTRPTLGKTAASHQVPGCTQGAEEQVKGHGAETANKSRTGHSRARPTLFKELMSRGRAGCGAGVCSRTGDVTTDATGLDPGLERNS